MGRQCEPWQRQIGESHKAFEAYDLYQKMGTNRSYAKVAETLGKSDTLICTWGRKWHWVDRVREYDNMLAAQEMEERKNAIRSMLKRQAQAGTLMQQKGVEALKNTPAEVIPSKIASELIVNGAKLERDARLYGYCEKAEDGEEEQEQENSGVIIVNDAYEDDSDEEA